MDLSLSVINLLEVVGVIVLAWLIGHILISELIKHSERAGSSQGQRVTVARWIKTLAIVFAVIGVLGVLGLGSQIELLTAAGLAGVIVGMMFQGFLANVLAGIITFKEDAVRVGDVVEVTGGGKGRVVKVKMTKTWIMTDNGALYVLGNGELDRGRIWNYTAAERLKKEFDA
jgi:small-conductance mechanosensitive channel